MKVRTFVRTILRAYVSNIETHFAIAIITISLKTIRTESEKERWIMRLANATRIPSFVVRNALLTEICHAQRYDQ
jgi:hypothetical protein